MKREPGEGPRYIYTCPLRTVSTDTSIPKLGNEDLYQRVKKLPMQVSATFIRRT